MSKKNIEEFRDWLKYNVGAGNPFLSSRGCGKTDTISNLWPYQPRNVITEDKKGKL